MQTEMRAAQFLRDRGSRASETILVFVAGREYGVGGAGRRGSSPEATMQFVLMLVAVAAAVLLDVRASQAYQGPWCAGTNRGGGSFVYNCSLRTFDQCVSEVIAGNRGFCSPNPYYRGPEGPPPRGKRKRYYY